MKAAHAPSGAPVAVPGPCRARRRPGDDNGLVMPGNGSPLRIPQQWRAPPPVLPASAFRRQVQCLTCEGLGIRVGFGDTPVQDCLACRGTGLVPPGPVVPSPHPGVSGTLRK